MRYRNGFFLLVLGVGVIIFSLQILLPSFRIGSKIKSANFNRYDFNDSHTKVFIADKNVLYSYTFDGSTYKKIASFDDEIFRIERIPFTKDLYVVTIKTDENDIDHWKNWILEENSKSPRLVYDQDKEEVPHEYMQLQRKLELSTRNEEIFPGSNGDLGDILSDKFDGSVPQEIGRLGKPMIPQACEIGYCPTEKHYPYGFFPSFSGEYLLTDPPGGGGLGEQAFVFSRDGSKTYPIDFYWYVSSAIWTSGNTLLTSDKKIYTFYPNGKFDEEEAAYIEGEFTQKSLSPSKQYLVLLDPSQVDETLTLLNLQNKSKVQIVRLDLSSFQRELDKQNIGKEFEDNVYGNLQPIGWNDNSDKFLYFEAMYIQSTDPKAANKTLSRELKFFDVNNNKSYKLGNFKSDSTVSGISFSIY